MLVDTLANVQSASLQLRGAADVLGPRLQSGELVDDLERLVGNAADASADLQAITASLNNPANLVLLQQTLESARDALASAQKVMADVDEITGDPAIRQQLRNLINGLGNLVSSTQSLEQQTEVASMLAPLNEQAQQQAQQPARRDRLDQLANEQIQAEQPVSPATAPLLIFDGERYILRPTDQLAGSPDEAADKNVR